MAPSATDPTHIKPSSFNSGRKVRIVGKIKEFPESEKKSADGSSSSWISVQKTANELVDGVKVLLKDQASCSKEYKLDYCYEDHEDMYQIFSREVKPLIPGIFCGINASVIAYGARGSGKTHLIQGSDEKPGLATSTMVEILSTCEETGSLVRISCYEAYHDHIYDLLEPKEQEVLVLEANGGQVQLKGLSQVQVKSISEFNKFYFHGCNQRKSVQKAASDVTRRSHKGLIIYLCSSDRNSKVSVVGKINFVDLAGYEDSKRMSINFPQLAENQRINKSLYAMENVVRALNVNDSRVPFRDTKLTRMLQDSIDGTSRALMITCLNPTFCQDTIHVISWASRSLQASMQTCQGSTKRIKCEAKSMGSTSSPVGRLGKLSYSVKKLGGSVSRFAEKKTTNTPHQLKRRNLFNVKRPIVESVQENSASTTMKATKDLTIEEENFQTILDLAIEPAVLKEEKSSSIIVNPMGTFTPKQDTCRQDEPDHQNVTDVGFDGKTSTSPTGCKMETPPVYVGSSEPISTKLREITNTLKALSSAIPFSMMTPNTDNLKNGNACNDMTESFIPGDPVSLRINDNWEATRTCTPGDTFKVNSCGLKKSLVQEYLKFLNSASKDELKRLKGIGEKRASYILELREESSEPFKSLDNLKEIGLSSKQIKGIIMKEVAGDLFSLEDSAASLQTKPSV